jgi:DNA invertase Pin-like site-specific DNA recombinase
MKAIGYVRVSTEDQATNGVSLAAQETKIRAYCVAKDWELTEVLRDEGVSAKDLNRPGMQKLLQGCKKGSFDVVVVLKLDRLTRSVKDLGYLVEDVFNRHGVAFSSLQDNFDTSTANGRMVMNILATIAQWERDIISERTRDAMRFMKSSMKLVGAVPFGFDNRNGHLVPNPDEMETVQRVLRFKHRGDSYHSIAENLTAQGITSKRGANWYPKTVLGIIRHIQTLPGEDWVITKYGANGVESDVSKHTSSKKSNSVVNQ